MYFDRNATQNGAKRSGSDGMDRRSNAAWVSPQAASTGIVRREAGDGAMPVVWMALQVTGTPTRAVNPRAGRPCPAPPAPTTLRGPPES